jgi:signal transduction histidine kinase
MKLIYKTARYYLIFALFIFGLGTVVFYYVIKIILIDSIDEAIHQEKIQLIENLNYERVIEELKPSENISIKPIESSLLVPDKYATVFVSDSNQNLIDYRELTSIYEHNGNYYQIKIRQSLEEAESLLNGILPAEIGLFLIFLIGVLIVNNFVNRSTWQPFYDLLEKIKLYDFEKTKIINYQPTDISEFNELGKSVEKMTHKIYHDFVSQKEFNENSSHELQTPVAILKNKLELLIQSPNLQEKEMDLIQEMFDAINRLSLLNKGLILISKIENRQFSDSEIVNLSSVLEKIISAFEDQLQEKEISVQLDLNKKTTIRANSILMEILFSNLISNAIKHNYKNGKISIRLHDSIFSIENTGNVLSKPAENMFERFQKDGTLENSVGLGLAIVKKICLLEGFEVYYLNEGSIHKITISNLDNLKNYIN